MDWRFMHGTFLQEFCACGCDSLHFKLIIGVIPSERNAIKLGLCQLSYFHLKNKTSLTLLLCINELSILNTVSF